MANVLHTFGPKPKLVKWVDTGVIRPKLLYACQAWADKMSDEHIKKMKRLDRLITTAMAPIQRSTPQATLKIMFDIVPIDLLTERSGATSFLRTKTHLQPYSDTPNGHLKRWEQIVSRFDIPRNTDVIENTVMLNRPFNVNIVSLNDDSKNYMQHSEYTAYTEGSKMDEKAGS